MKSLSLCLVVVLLLSPLTEAGKRHNYVHRPHPVAMAIPNGPFETIFIDGGINFLGAYNFLITVRILLSWVPQAYNVPFLQPVFLVTDPYLNVFRRLPMQLGGLDFSIIPAVLLLQFAQGGVAALGSTIPEDLKDKLPRKTKEVFQKSAAFLGSRPRLPTLVDGFRALPGLRKQRD